MSTEEYMKIQKSVLKVSIHCEGCKHKVKKVLQKIDGVFTTEIDAEQGKVTVSGIVDPSILIKKLVKSGKRAELWGAPKSNNENDNQNQNQNQNHLVTQFKNLQIGNGKNDNGNNTGQKGINIPPKVGGGIPGPNPQQLQQLQQVKSFQDLKLLPQSKLPPSQNQNQLNQKAVKFNLSEEKDDELDDEFRDDDSEDEDFDDDEINETLAQQPVNKMKQPLMANNPSPNMLNTMNMMKQPLMANNPSSNMLNAMNMMKQPLMANNPSHNMLNAMNMIKQPLMANNPSPNMLNAMNMMNAQKGCNMGPLMKGEGGPVPSGPMHIQLRGMGGVNGGKKDGSSTSGGGGNNRNQGRGGGNNNMNIGNNWNGAIKSGNLMEANPSMNKGFPNMVGGGEGNMNTRNLYSNMSMPQMGSGIGIQGLPSSSMSTGVGVGAGTSGNFQGVGLNVMPGNPNQQQQQQMAAMMNHPREIGNQPMMYAPQQPAMNYMYTPPQYPYPPPQDPYSNYFSDENTSSCNIM
ncbi:heavy metal-associated isoprenylated plant protein 33-like [Senna tora]|uniref:Heavy metal-associated isoprenylated plant protein 33-like n=1 Tax=Senna tora TaxID=362788 RepID=A0A834X3Y5_9FABA|nr:heavy metal-associated isoprenylated plant protein 33-like [Senna tora]